MKSRSVRKGIAFVYDTCPLNEFARRHGYLDFLPNLCYIDQIACSAAHGKLVRHNIAAALKAAGFSKVKADHHPNKPWLTVLAEK